MDMTAYSKTNAERLLAFEPKPGIATAMRELLKRVDGKTSSQQLVNLTGEAELFAELWKRDPVKAVPQAWRNSAASSYARPNSQANQHSQSGVPATSKM